MADTPRDRPKRRKSSKKRRVEDRAEDAAVEPVDAAPSEPPSERDPRSDRAPKRSPFRGEVIWPLVAGLAVGFVIGREVGGYSSGPEDAAAVAVSASATAAAADGDLALGPGAITEAELGGRGGLEGLDDGQKAIVLKALNARDCECGCPFGTLANCLAKDPNCPRSPAIAKLAVEKVKSGADLAQVLAAIDDKQKSMAGGQAAPAPTGPVCVKIAAHNPRKGPDPAKVTIVEFSDFQ